MRRLVLLFLWPSVAAASEDPAPLIAQLSKPEASAAAVERLVSLQSGAVPALIGEALEGQDVSGRGWAIVSLGRIGGGEAERALSKLAGNVKESRLVRTWAAAGLIALVKDADGLVALGPLVARLPGLNRPFTLRATELASSGKLPVGKMLALVAGNWQLQATLGEAILAGGAGPLVEAMTHGKTTPIRTTAAGYLATLAQKRGSPGVEAVGSSVIKAYAFKPGARAVPWDGGPLYIPAINWDKPLARKLLRELIAWMVWAERNQKTEVTAQIVNNLSSVGLTYTAGYPGNGADAAGWLASFGQVEGAPALRALLEEQGVQAEPRFAEVLARQEGTEGSHK